MEEIAKVIKTENDRATIRVDKRSECDKCGMCLFPKNASHVDLIALNGINAEEGDEVIFSPAERSKTLAIILVFLIPLILVCLSVVFTYLFIKMEIIALILSLGSIIVWFAFLSVIDKKMLKSGKFSPEIIKVIKKAEKEDCN